MESFFEKKENVIALAVAGAILWFGYNQSQTNAPSPLPDQTVEVSKPSEEQTWKDFAKWVETQKDIQDTDHVVSMAKALKDFGHISNYDRLSPLMNKRSEMTDDVRQSVVRMLRQE